MKKILLGAFFAVLAFSLTAGTSQASTEIGERLQGRILLQVEENGEAWYVYPEDDRRYYLGRPLDAWNIMRYLGLGITNEDLNKIPTKDVAWDGEAGMIDRLKGHILLQVEENGEAWYLSPVNGKRYYMGRPEDAFSIMRYLGLGVQTAELFTIDPNVEVSNINYQGAEPNEPDEFVEIRNYGYLPVNLKKWIMSDLDLKNIYQFRKNVVLDHNQAVRIYTNQGEFSFNSSKPLWDANDITMLIDSSETLIDVYLDYFYLLQ